MKRGTAILQAADARYVAEREAVIVTQRCANCDWHGHGTVKEMRELFLAHRLEAHPEIQPKPRRKRHRFVGQMNVGKTLDENIENARKQGASGWESAADPKAEIDRQNRDHYAPGIPK